MDVVLHRLTVPEADLGPYVEIGNGGMAKVHSLASFIVPEAPSRQWVYKKYRKKARPVPLYGLQSLASFLDAMPEGQRKAFEKCCNWPVRAVVDEQGASGVILPLLQDDYFLTLRVSDGTTKRKPAELQFLFTDRSYCARVGIPFADEMQRRQLCLALCRALAVLHRADVVYGDISSRNILFRLAPKPSVQFVDCDAVRVAGNAAALGKQPHSPDWEPPEAVAAKRRKDSTGYNIQSKATDLYKLGLAILRILTPGPGTSTVTDPAAARGVLPPYLLTLLQRALGDDPSRRPSAKTWHEELIR